MMDGYVPSIHLCASPSFQGMLASPVLGNTSADAVAGAVGGMTSAGGDDVSLQAEQRSNVDKMTV
jgi:hypothetical protein